MQADFAILDKLNYQPEFKLPIWDYLSGLVDDERIADGRAGLSRHADVLQRIQTTYGVDPATVVAVWGVESNYGRITGKYPLVQALGTLSCFGRRQGYFQGEFYAALRILQRGDIAPDRLFRGDNPIELQCEKAVAAVPRLLRLEFTPVEPEK